MSKTLFLILCTTALISFAQAADGPRKFSCTGSLIEPHGLNPATKTAQFSFGPSTATVVVDDRTITAPITSNNEVALKFANDQTVASFFHYTNDLFVEYKTGHLAKLSCAEVN